MEYVVHHNIRLVIFDLDGTLVDSEEAISSCFNLALMEMGYSQRPVSDVSKLIGIPLKDMFESFIDQNDVDEAVSRYRHHYQTVCLERTKLLDGTVTFLKFLQALNVKRAVATNKPLGFTHDILKATGIFHLFDWISGPEDVSVPKPDPAMLQLVMDKLETAADHTVYVGDSLTDCLTARACGIRMFAVTTGAHTAEELLTMQPDWLGDSLYDLQVFLEKQREGRL